MDATVISTGEELVGGRTVDTNAAFIASGLTRHGFHVRRIIVLGDDPDALAEEVAAATRDSRLIVISGGLGPTADDRTRAAIAAVAGAELVEDGASRRHVVERLAGFGIEADRRHLSQALFPAGSTLFPNERGTARGFACRVGEACLVAMPGVPAEMRAMFTDGVLPFVLGELAPRGCLKAEHVHIFPAAESAVDERIADLTERGRNPSVGLTVRDGVITVHIAARAESAEEAEGLAERDARAVEERFGELAFGRGEATLASALAEELERAGATVGVAESVTGGLIGHMLVDVPGISRFFLADVVAYGNEAKVDLLGVPRELIAEHGAVSPQVAEAMAHGARRAAGSDLAVSTTGIAGPTGGSAEKPVGLVYVGLCLGGRARVARLELRGERRRVKDRAARHALNFCRLALGRGLASVPARYTM